MDFDPRRVFPADLGEIREVEVLSGGLSGAASYAITTSEGAFVLRWQPRDRATWQRSVAMQRLAASRGVAPAIVHVDETEAVSIAVRVTGTPLGAAAADPSVRSAAFASLVEMLARLRAVDRAEGPPGDDPPLAAKIWASQAKRPGFPQWAAGLGERLAAARTVMERDPRRVLGHGDLHPMNILWDGTRVWLLDWERAGWHHPCTDPATLSNFMNLPDDAALGLLGALERTTPDAAAAEIFGATRTYGRIVYGTVFLSLVPDLEKVGLAPGRDETPSLADCYGLMAAGKLSASTPEGQALIGAALLKQA